MVVLLVACLGTAATANADAEVQGVAELDAFLGPDVGDVNICAVVFFCFFLKTGDDFIQLIPGEFAVVGLEEFVDGGAFFPLGERSHGLGEGGDAKGGTGGLEDVAPVEEVFAGGDVVAAAVAVAGFFCVVAHTGIPVGLKGVNGGRFRCLWFRRGSLVGRRA